MRRWWYRRILVMLVLLAMTMGTGFGVTSLQEEEKKQQVSTKSFDSKDNLYDNIIDCIEWLIKEGYFNMEYLEAKI